MIRLDTRDELRGKKLLARIWVKPDSDLRIVWKHELPIDALSLPYPTIGQQLLLGFTGQAQLLVFGDIVAHGRILGDTAQHGSVEAGSPLRLLETRAGIRPAQIREIQRQSGEYKLAVEAISDGRVLEGFDRLDELKWIKEVPTEERYRMMADDYITTIGSGHSCLVISPTHSEGRKITEQIQLSLRAAKKLKGEEHELPTLHNAGLTTAQRGDASQLADDAVIEFTQNAKGGFRRGQRLNVGESTAIPLELAESYQVYRTGSISVSAGDLIRITKNGLTADKAHDLNNGAVYRVKGFTETGDLVLNNDWVVKKDYGHLALGYVATSMASQGKDYKVVLVGQSWESRPASSAEQFYVSASRGEKECRIYCDNKEELRDAVSRFDERLTATELFDSPAVVPVRYRQRQQEVERKRQAERAAERQLEVAYER